MRKCGAIRNAPDVITQITVVEDWIEELTRQVPARFELETAI